MQRSTFHVSRTDLRGLAFPPSPPASAAAAGPAAPRATRGAPPAAPDPMLGRCLGEYRVLHRLGAGGMGLVYLAVHDLLDRQVALKVIAGALAHEETYVQRFLHEARLTLALDHPNIRRIHDVRREGDAYYMVMEYVDGQALHSLVKGNGPLDPHLAVRITGKIAKALEFARRREIIHRDVKPSNVLIGRTGAVKVTDFGLAKALSETTGFTVAGTVVGTPEYMSPEQFEGRGIDHRSDMYALGATLYYLLTGHPPFEAPDVYALLAKHRGEEPASPRRYNPRVPLGLAALVLRLLEKSPADRFAEYADLLAALEAETGGAAGAAAAVPAGGAAPTAASAPAPGTAGLPGGGRGPIPAGERRWIEDERYEEGLGVQKEFEAAGLAPPPIGEVEARMERMREARPARDDGPAPAAGAWRCAGCGAEIAPAGGICPRSPAGVAATGAPAAPSVPAAGAAPAAAAAPAPRGAPVAPVAPPAAPAPPVPPVPPAPPALPAEPTPFARPLACPACARPFTNLPALAFTRDHCRLDARFPGHASAPWPEIVAALEDAVARTGAFPVLDFTATQRLGSDDAAYLMRLFERFTPAGPPLTVIAGRPQVRTLLDTLGVAQFLRVFPDRTAFDDAFRAGRICPHATRWLAEMKGIAAYGAASLPATAALVAPCVAAATFRTAYARLEHAVAAEDAEGVRQLEAAWRATLPAPCCEAALALACRTARELVLLSLSARGNALLGQHRCAEAAEVFTRLLAADPAGPGAWHYRALAWLGLGRLDEAVADLRAALERSGGAAPYALLLGGALRRRGDLPAALAAYGAALARDPACAPALAERAGVRFALRDLPGALADLDRAVELRPENTAYLTNRGKVRHHLGRVEEALADFEAAATADPDDAVALNNLGALLVGRGQAARARRLLETAARLDPRSWRPHFNLARLATRCGDPEAALSHLAEAVARGLDRPELIRRDPTLAPVVQREGYVAWEREVFRNPPRPTPPGAAPLELDEDTSTLLAPIRG